jgi:hypothetical protein
MKQFMSKIYAEGTIKRHLSQYGSLKNTMKTKEINKGCSLSGVEWDTIENQ